MYKPCSTTVDNPYAIVGLWNNKWFIKQDNFNNTEEVRLLTHTFSIDNDLIDNIYFSLWNPGSSIEYYGAKLERGPVSTLAYKYNGEWKLNQQQNYLQELLKCRQYLINFKGRRNSNIIGNGVAHATTGANFHINLTVPLKYQTPVVISENKLYCTGTFNDRYRALEPVKIERIYSQTENALHVDCQIINTDINFIQGNCYALYSSTVDFFISCEI